MRRINTRAELKALAAELGVNGEWHEPSEQNITASVEGNSFDNAMPPGEWYGASDDPYKHAEMHVIIKRWRSGDYQTDGVGEHVAVVNLATLFAWACGLEPDKPPVPEGVLYKQATGMLRSLLASVERLEDKPKGQKTVQDRQDIAILAVQIDTLCRVLGVMVA